ncbi:sulfurtransferase complex subunit TusB [Candidatus Palibaumannia cicadellinicola]|uniref:Intracellular sulfur oxidation protein DsrH n=1 Tax=Baumannia cicadellinicola subsp. Homalodisca coagulata TaxID=374463 RepID=Q1LSY8_BAUCH|nr:sulfurtransferase complex subunit TusB [Candidatus Baumannia cicadellinicola]ABF14092.1 intracellular sulfur oxidation protein DsrH [Baumannia cicadellinicola str. Hc (Homalodisca coagulata)]MBS0032757.1 sulfurtransferase complex subunit TusB [Candidatus Baumannia cicadellinicola]MCJ7462036.1 sulfurtransferase complex subunit TusB [Candidatus Baumannia cicadellinicola]MCJ7463063.1 sulfurtransferase complex subunit TusB [Candidatus Baumannia cicadellinicola]
MLYTISHSPYLYDIKWLLQIITPKDDILLWADGVISGLNNSPTLHALTKTSLTIYALKNDILARGLYPHFSRTIVVISYTEFVMLTEKHSQQIAW